MNVEKLTTTKNESNQNDEKKNKLFSSTIISKSTIIDNTTPVGLVVSFSASDNLLIATTEADTQLSKFGN